MCINHLWCRRSSEGTGGSYPKAVSLSKVELSGRQRLTNSSSPAHSTVSSAPLNPDYPLYRIWRSSAVSKTFCKPRQIDTRQFILSLALPLRRMLHNNLTHHASASQVCLRGLKASTLIETHRGACVGAQPGAVVPRRKFQGTFLPLATHLHRSFPAVSSFFQLRPKSGARKTHIDK